MRYYDITVLQTLLRAFFTSRPPRSDRHFYTNSPCIRLYTHMSDVISFRADEEVAGVISREIEEDRDDPSRSEVTRRLVKEAVDARRTPIGTQLGLSDRRAAQLESIRRPGETEKDVVADLLREALDAREADVLDALGASDELRDAVEAEREDGESLDGAVERLLRLGVDADTGPPSIWRRLGVAGAFVGSGGLFLVLNQTAGLLGVVFVALALIVYLAAYPQIEAATESLSAGFGS